MYGVSLGPPPVRRGPCRRSARGSRLSSLHGVAAESASAAGEREFRPRSTGRMFPWIKWASLIELAVFAGLVVVWLLPGLEGPTSILGLAHGLGFVALCILIWIAVMRREVPFWLLASALTPVGPVGSSIGVSYIERRERRDTQIDNADSLDEASTKAAANSDAPQRRNGEPADIKSNV